MYFFDYTLAERGRFTPPGINFSSPLIFSYFFGGEREIRTPGRLPYTPFPRVRTKPLCDLSTKQVPGLYGKSGILQENYWNVRKRV